MSSEPETGLVATLDAIKRLMILLLFERGYTQRQIALALGVNQGTVSRMFPAGVLKRPDRRADEAD